MNRRMRDCDCMVIWHLVRRMTAQPVGAPRAWSWNWLVRLYKHLASSMIIAYTSRRRARAAGMSAWAARSLAVVHVVFDFCAEATGQSH